LGHLANAVWFEGVFGQHVHPSQLAGHVVLLLVLEEEKVILFVTLLLLLSFSVDN
jgi:hypothetical protein